MKSTGIVRNVDELGRIVIPKEIRDVLGFREKQDVEIFVNDDEIVLKKYDIGCTFCTNSDDIFLFKGKFVCNTCRNDISNKK